MTLGAKRIKMKLEFKSFNTKEDMMTYMNSEEVMKPIRDYMEQVHTHCTEGLSIENKQLYHDWHDGKYKPSYEEQIKTAKENPELYNSIMASISLGLG